MRILLVMALVAVSLAGCTSEPTDTAPVDGMTQDPDEGAWKPDDTPEIRQAYELGTDENPAAVVVADLGGGANVYHKDWRRPNWTHHPSDVIRGFPEDAVALNLTLGDDYEASYKADADVWASIEEGVLYWVPGTNLLGYVHRPYASVDAGHGSQSFHGAGTTDAINQACPDCYVLYVQDSGSMDGESVAMLAEWDWVDIVTSTNTPGSYCLPCGEQPFIGGSPNYAKATKALHDRGGLFVAATGNMPVNGFVNPDTPLPWYDYCCTPWVVNVGGAQHECAAGISLAGKVPEVTGDYTQRVTGTETTDGYAYLSGTSFATPQVAGRFGATLLELRQTLGDTRDAGVWWSGAPGEGPFLDDGRITQEEVRFALQRAGTHWTAADYDPTALMCTIMFYAGDVNTPRVPNPLGFTHPVGPVPAIDLGWGYLGEDAPSAAVAMLLGESPVPERDALTTETMAAQMAWRQAMRG